MTEVLREGSWGSGCEPEKKARARWREDKIGGEILGVGDGRSKAEVVLGPQNCPDLKPGCLSTLRREWRATPTMPAAP